MAAGAMVRAWNKARVRSYACAVSCRPHACVSEAVAHRVLRAAGSMGDRGAQMAVGAVVWRGDRMHGDTS